MESLIIWKVKTPGTFPIQPGKYIFSSTFYVDNYREVGFFFSIRGEDAGDQIGSLFLSRCDIDGPENVEVVYRITANFRQRKVFERKNQFFTPRHDVSYSCFETYVAPIMKTDLFGGKLKIICLIKSYKNDEDVGSELLEEENFVDLSKAFTELFESPLFSDAVIRTPNKEFKIHKAVLEVRCPALLKECQTEESEKAYSQYDEHTLKELLYYIYTGRLKSENIPDELYCLLKHSNDCVFNHLFPTFPYTTCLKTTFGVKEIDFCWTIENFLNFSQQNEWCHKITSGETYTWFKLTFHTFQSEDKTKHLEFRMHKMAKTTTVFVMCSIHVLGIEGPHTIFEGNYLFTDEYYPWRVQLDHGLSFISESEFSGNAHFFIHLCIASGKFVNSVKFVAVHSMSGQNVKESLHGLGHDIKKLYENRQHSDVVLKVKSKSIPAHKAILSARSPVFHRMLQKITNWKKSAEVVINDLDEKVALSVLYYIYSAQVVNLDIDHAFELYKAADLYEILPLKSKCSKFLELSLTSTNVGEILLFADAQNDCELKKSVYKFITTHPTDVLKSKQSMGIMRSFHYFHLDALKEIYTHLAKKE